MQKKQPLTKHELEQHRKVLNDLNAVLATLSGRNVIKALMRDFGVGELPLPYTKAEDLIEQVAFLRTGKAIYELVVEANPQMANILMTEIVKEKLDENTTIENE